LDSLAIDKQTDKLRGLGFIYFKPNEKKGYLLQMSFLKPQGVGNH